MRTLEQAHRVPLEFRGQTSHHQHPCKNTIENLVTVQVQLHKTRRACEAWVLLDLPVISASTTTAMLLPWSCAGCRSSFTSSSMLLVQVAVRHIGALLEQHVAAKWELGRRHTS